MIEDGTWRLEFRDSKPVEGWNAQLSLLTGIAAASIMVDGKVGILRTLPPADPRAVERLRRTARALRIDWPEDLDYPGFIRSLDPSKPSHQAMVVACTSLLRGAGYAVFDGELPKHTEHAALATTYAHVTAPLRRLVDRYAQEICVALCAGERPPDWVLEALPDLPSTMQEAGRRANTYEHAVTDLVEAELLKGSVGEKFTGVVLEVDGDDPTHGLLQLAEPATEARVVGADALPVGAEIEVVLAVADPGQRKVEFRR